MNKTKLIVLLALVCVFALSIPTFAQLAAGGWPKYQHDAYNSGRSPATAIAKPVVDWTYAGGFTPSRFGLTLDAAGNAYVVCSPAGNGAKISSTGSFLYSLPSIASGTNRIGVVLADGYAIYGPGRGAAANYQGYTHGLDPATGTELWTSDQYNASWLYSAGSNTYTTPAVGEDGRIYVHTHANTYDPIGPIFSINPANTSTNWMFNVYLNPAGDTWMPCGKGGINGSVAVKTIPAAGSVPAHNRIFVSGSNQYHDYLYRADRHTYQVFAIDDLGTAPSLAWGAAGMLTYGPPSLSNDGNTVYVASADNWGTYSNGQTPRPSTDYSVAAYDASTGGTSQPADAWHGTGEPKWTISTGTSHCYPPAVAADGTLYVASSYIYDYIRTMQGRITSITDHGDHATINWTLDLPDDGWSECSNIVVTSTNPKVIYVGAGDATASAGRIYAIEDDGDHAKILWTYQGANDAAGNWPAYLALNDNGDLYAEFGNTVLKFDAGFDVDNPNGISGYVKDSAGNPIADAWVAASTSPDALINDPGRVRTRTSADGYYQLGVKSAGTYYVAATAQNYSASAEQTATLITTADVVKKDFTLQTPGFNWALLATATCDNALSGMEASFSVDGNVTSLFAAASPYGALTVDLGSAKTIGEAAIYWETGYSSNFTIDYSSDGSSWSSAKTAGTANGGFTVDYYVNTGADNKDVPKQKTGYQVVKFTPQTARYWRVNTTAVAGSSYETMWELELRDAAIASVPPTVGGARTAPEGGGIKIDTAVVTATTDGGGTPTDTIFIEDANRTAGIKVHMTSMPTAIRFGDKVKVTGKVYTTTDGEDYIEAVSVTRLTTTQSPDGPAIEELSMNNKAAADTVSQGLFIKTWGKVSDVDSTSFTISDGSASAIKVLCGTATKPADDDYVRVRGVVGKDANGPVLYMRNERADWAYDTDGIHALPFTGEFDYPIQYLVLGPFTDSGKTRTELLAEDFIGEANVGVTVMPAEGLTTAGKTWLKATSTDGILDINATFGATTTNAVAYAHLYVWSDTEEPTVALATGSDDALKYYVNGGTEAFSIDAPRGCTIGTDTNNITLHQGLNSILFKVVNGDAAFQLSSQCIDGSFITGTTGYGGYQPYTTTNLGYSLNPATP